MGVVPGQVVWVMDLVTTDFFDDFSWFSDNRFRDTSDLETHFNRDGLLGKRFCIKKKIA